MSKNISYFHLGYQRQWLIAALFLFRKSLYSVLSQAHHFKITRLVVSLLFYKKNICSMDISNDLFKVIQYFSRSTYRLIFLLLTRHLIVKAWLCPTPRICKRSIQQKRFHSKQENASRRTHQCLADMLSLPFEDAVNYLLVFWSLLSDGTGECSRVPCKVLGKSQLPYLMFSREFWGTVHVFFWGQRLPVCPLHSHQEFWGETPVTFNDDLGWLCLGAHNA